MKLFWTQRADGLWNAECACGTTLAGCDADMRETTEVWHFTSSPLAPRTKDWACGPAPDWRDLKRELLLLQLAVEMERNSP